MRKLHDLTKEELINIINHLLEELEYEHESCAEYCWRYIQQEYGIDD